MPPSVESVILAQLAETRAEMRDGFRELREAVNGYDHARCDSHTERLTAIASRVDTAEAATRALTEARRQRWGRLAQSLGIMAAVAALVTLGMRLVGI